MRGTVSCVPPPQPCEICADILLALANPGCLPGPEPCLLARLLDCTARVPHSIGLATHSRLMSAAPAADSPSMTQMRAIGGNGTGYCVALGRNQEDAGQLAHIRHRGGRYRRSHETKPPARHPRRQCDHRPICNRRSGTTSASPACKSLQSSRNEWCRAPTVSARPGSRLVRS